MAAKDKPEERIEIDAVSVKIAISTGLQNSDGKNF
jgi:hypothetical protein